MRIFSFRNGIVFVLLQCSFFWGCTTVPQDAPQEFHTAKAALERAKKADVDDTLPHTTVRVEQEFDEALKLYIKSRDRDIKEASRDDLLKSSRDKAVNAQALTEEALALQEQIKSWDNRIEGYSKMTQEKEAQSEQLKQLQAQVTASAAQLQAQPDTQVQSEPTVAASPNVTIKGPVAYFGSSQTQVDPRYRDNITSLANTLKADEDAKVTLAGFSDPRGNKELNNRLARDRAENVAEILKERGVTQNQIIIETWPAVSKKGKSNRTEAELQLDRRVEAFISNNTTENAPKERAR